MIGIPPTTLNSMLNRGLGKASIDNVLKVCKGLGITVEELEEMADRGLSEDEVSKYVKEASYPYKIGGMENVYRNGKGDK